MLNFCKPFEGCRSLFFLTKLKAIGNSSLEMLECFNTSVYYSCLKGSGSHLQSQNVRLDKNNGMLK